MCRAYMLAVGVLASFVSGLVGWWAWISRQEMDVPEGLSGVGDNL